MTIDAKKVCKHWSFIVKIASSWHNHTMTDEQKKRAIELTLQGYTRIKIRDDLGVSNSHWYKTIDQDSLFATDLARARGEALEDLADTLLTITDEEDDVYRAKVKSENIKWVLSKRKPSVYGDKIDVNVNQIISLDAALSDAKARIKDVTNHNLLTCDNHNTLSYKQTDTESVGSENRLDQTDDDDPDDIFS